MSFVLDKEVLKPGLIIFRRSDVAHRNWYCRVKIPKADRYKTVSLKTSDINAARTEAWRQDTRVGICIETDMPVFDRPFRDIAEDYARAQELRARTGRITAERVKRIRSVIKAQLNPYIGSTQISRIGEESWTDYPDKRRERGAGRLREIVSDATIRFEMSIFRAVMTYAAKKKFIRSAAAFSGRLGLEKMRRDEFTPKEYRALHTFARGWVEEAPDESRRWYRTMAYNFLLIMCNTGMRPSEARNLRWRDVSISTDREGRKLVVLQVRGKKKQRQLVAAGNVGKYLERIREISLATGPDDAVFSTLEGLVAGTLYKAMVRDLLEKSKLLIGPNGTPRSTYSFRHTYATFRLGEGVDVYFLAHQMGTSVQMIEDHYGHVNAVKNAAQILRGLPGWEAAPNAPPAAASAAAPATPSTKDEAEEGAPTGTLAKPEKKHRYRRTAMPKPRPKLNIVKPGPGSRAGLRARPKDPA